LVERHPEFGPAHLQLAYCYWEMGRRNQAIETVRRAMNLLPMNPDPARAATKYCAAEAHWQDMLDAAQAWKNRAPDEEVLADQFIAVALIRLGRSDAAVAQLQAYLEWARSDPDRYGDVLTTYCIAAANAGHPQEIEALMWPLTSTSPTWRARCAEVACELNDAAEGKRLMARVEAITPPDAFSEQLSLGQAYERLANRLNDAELRQKATRITAQAVAAPKASAVALAAAGAQAERLEDFDTAREYYRRAIQMDGTLFVAKNNLAMLIVRSHGDLVEARQLATDAIRLQPGIASVHDTLAYVDASAGDKRGAAEAERDAVKLEPTEPTWQVRLAQYLLDGGDVAKAQEIVQSLSSGGQSEQALTPQLRQQLDSIRKRLKAPALTSS
jgi:tetratricopeptide (TPR) repeat protein